MLSVTIGDLTIGDAPSGTSSMWVSTLTRPTLDYDRSYAGSPFMPPVQVHAVLGTGELTLTVVAEATTSAGLATLRGQLQAALAVFAYTLTIVEDGVTEAWEADCAVPAWNDHSAAYAKAHLAVATVTIPVYPIPA
jgi:hypothetical protein